MRLAPTNGKILEAALRAVEWSGVEYKSGVGKPNSWYLWGGWVTPSWEGLENSQKKRDGEKISGGEKISA